MASSRHKNLQVTAHLTNQYGRSRLSRIFLLGLFLTMISAGNVYPAEVIGVLPFHNQRDKKTDDWIGIFIRSRLIANLRHHSSWQFHASNTLSLWQKGDPEQRGLVSPQNTILISGNFQIVLGYGHLTVRIRRTAPIPVEPDLLTTSFKLAALETAVDLLSLKAGRWISASYQLPSALKFPRWNQPHNKQFFEYRQRLFDDGPAAEIRQTLSIQEKLDRFDSPDALAVIFEGMLVMSSQVSEKERGFLLQQTETMLRQALLKTPQNSRLLGLFSEVFLLQSRDPMMVQKIAEDAASIDPQNDLALLMMVFSSNQNSEERETALEKLTAVNPLVISNPDGYQKGLLKSYFKGLK